MSWREIITYIFRATEATSSIVILGLSSGYLAESGNNREVNYSLAVAILNLIYFGYSQTFVPSIGHDRTSSTLIFCCEGGLAILYLAAMASIANDYPTHCSDSSCRMYQAILPFDLFNWLLFSVTFILFVGYSYIPEISTYGFVHTFRFSDFEYGTIFASYLNGFGKPIPGANAEAQTGDVPAEAKDEEEAIAADINPDDPEANVGIASTEEHHEKAHSPDSTQEGYSNAAALALSNKAYP